MDYLTNPETWLPALAGFLFAFLIMKSRTASLQATLREQERSQRKADAEHDAQSALLHSELTQLRQSESHLLKRQGQVETMLESQLARQRETEMLLDTAEERFSHTFKSLSADALKLSQQQFLHLARSTFKNEQLTAQNELEKREQAVAHLIQPVADSLEKMQARLGDLEKARESAYATLSEQVRSMAESQINLQHETGQLVKALRQPAARGQWGEMQLRRVVEMAGMQEHCDFITQAHTSTDEGKSVRPDLVVKLPGGQQIVIDAKTPMDAYLEAIEAEKDDERDNFLKKHAAQVATHIRQLSSKGYQNQFQPTPEFVVLFLPSESFFSAALNQDPGLLEQGVDQGVILATPTTLIALLRAVAYGWRQEALTENARQISELGRDLHKRLATFTGHLAKVGKSLESSVKSYNQSIASLETRVLPAARRFEELETTEKQTTLGDPEDIDFVPRQLHQPTADTEPATEEEPADAEPAPDKAKEEKFQGFTIGDLENDPDKISAAESAASDLRSALNEARDD